ncbi:MAG: trypsin-like peptidase domain-containing protein [Acidimicrobiia bacterium]|nr:trypsin-like peptidase domain-containing protein [Acidimicrobiia bacterium]MDH5236595.1 trypsin-like peptidase domain-containing protein [Acidimicrobiia bacterium]
MNRRWVLSAVILIAVGTLGATVWLRDPAHDAGVEQTAMAIEAIGCGAVPTRGAGIAIGGQDVLTVAHVVAGADDVLVVDHRGHSRPATITAIDTVADLALLSVAGLSGPEVRFGELAPDRRGVLVDVGDDPPTTATYVVTDALLIHITDIYDKIESARQGYRVSASIEPGDSGAALFDADGRVGGMVFSRSRRSTEAAYATAADELEAFLDAVEGGRPAPAVPCRLR